MCILEAQVSPQVSSQLSSQLSPQVSPQVAILKTQPAQTTSKIKDFVLFMANICTRNEVSSIFAIKPAQDSSIQLYLSTARTKLARKRRNLCSCGRASFLYL